MFACKMEMDSEEIIKINGNNITLYGSLVCTCGVYHVYGNFIYFMHIRHQHFQHHCNSTLK